MIKKLLILVLVALTGGYLFTRNIASSASEFMQFIREEKFESAYARTSQSYQAQHSLEVFKKELADRELDQAIVSFWSTRSWSNGVGSMKANAMAGDHTVPVDLTLIWEEDQWKISRLGGIFYQNPRANTEMMLGLAKRTLVTFIIGMIDNDFTELWESCCQPFQAECSAISLTGTFYPFILQQDDLLPLMDPERIVVEQFFTRETDSGEILELTAQVPNKEATLQCEFKYLMEESEWRIFSIHLKTV